jgi:nitric oxide reductase NorQ protein
MRKIETISALEERIANWQLAAASDQARKRDLVKWQTAELLLSVRESRAWRLRELSAFGEFTEQLMGISETTANQMADVLAIYSELNVPFGELARLSFSKAQIVAEVVDAKSVKAWLEMIREETEQDLLDLVQQHLRHEDTAPENATQASEQRTSVVDSWMKAPPNESFYVDPRDWKALCYSVAHSQNVILMGHSGCGKTEVAQLVANAFERPATVFNFGAMSEPRTSLLGTINYSPDRGTWFGESRFLNAVRTPGTIIILDELSRCRAEAFNLILPLLDGQRVLAVDENASLPPVPIADGVTFVATANQGMQYSGTETFDQALLDRFGVIIHVQFPPQQNEIRILTVRTGICNRSAEILVRIAVDQRKLTGEGTFVSQLSTRSLLAAAKLAVAGTPLLDAVRYSLSNRFSDEGGTCSERQQFEVLIKKHMLPKP